MMIRSYPRVSTVAIVAASLGTSALPLLADQVIADDLIVQQSIAVGNDAVNGENFGFDTLRLKENNLQIHFDDTSTGTFPANDWRLIANDRASGGANYFAIEDSTAGRIPFRVDAGAPADALRVTNQGRIGIGTSNPEMKVEVHDGDTPTLRLNQSGGGWGSQTWDVAGNEANFIIRDITNGSKLPFRIKPGAPSNSIYIAASGDVGFGTDAPSAKLHVTGNAMITGTLEIGSSRTLKEDIRDLTLEEAQEAFDTLKPVHFRYKTESEQQLGFIAEDVPDLVASDSRKSLVPMDFVAVLTKVVQEQDRRVTELEKNLAERDEAIRVLASRLDALERNTTISASEEIREANRAARRDADDEAASASPAAIRQTNAEATQILNNGR